MSYVRDLDAPLLKLSPKDAFTLRDACAGVHIFGGIGSGKTSGSGRMLAGAYLRAGMGGLVTAVKPEEIALWKRYAAEHARSKSIVLFDENEGFNFLTYELARQGIDGIGTVTECLMRVLEAAKKASPTASQRGGEAFWEDATRQVLRYTILPLYIATGTLSIPDIIQFIYSAPTDSRMVTDPAWQKRSFMYGIMDAASLRPAVPVPRSELEIILSYWAEQFPTIPEKTRGNIVITVSSVLDRFKHGRLRRTFCDKTTLVPEMTFHGTVIVMAMPTLTWNEDGVIAQQLFKYMWQRAVLARNSLASKHQERPVFLWSDEAQETVSSYDAEFQSICRGSRACTVYLTQSLPTYYAKIGGDSPHDAAHALVGKFMTNIFHANACPDTNDYASRVIGKGVKLRGNYSSGSSQNHNFGMNEGSGRNSGTSTSLGSSYGDRQSSTSSSYGSNSGNSSNWGSNQGRGTSRNESSGYAESLEFLIEPGDFARNLKTGGQQNRNLVTGVWFQGGRIFRATSNNYLLETFAQ